MQFEYKIVRIDGNPFDIENQQSIVSHLNRLGKEGWELIMWHTNTPHNAAYIFKRPIR